MNDKGLVSKVNNAGDAVAGLESGHWSGDEFAAVKVFDGSVVVTVFNILQLKTCLSYFWNGNGTCLNEKQFIMLRVELLPAFKFTGKIVNKMEFTGKIGKTGKR
jgi:hypothetical protein